MSILPLSPKAKCDFLLPAPNFVILKMKEKTQSIERIEEIKEVNDIEATSIQILKQKKVILIHGYNGSPKVFKDIKDSLEAKGVKVYSVKYDSRKDFEKWIKTIERKIKQVGGVENLYLVGHSLGGSLALYLSKKYKFKGIISINSPVYLKKLILIKLLVKALNKKKEVTIRKIQYSVDSVKSVLNFLNELKDVTIDSLDSALVIQSKKDKVVNPKSAKILYNHINSEHKQLVNVGYGHTPLSQPNVINSIMGFMGIV